MTARVVFTLDRPVLFGGDVKKGAPGWTFATVSDVGRELVAHPTTLVDNVVVNAGPGTIVDSMGAYVGGFLVSEDEGKVAMLYRWELAPPDAPLMDAEATGWMTPGTKYGQWHNRCTQLHTPPPPYILCVLPPVFILLYQK